MPDTSKWTQVDVDRHNTRVNLTGKGVRQTLSTTDNAPPPKKSKYRNQVTYIGALRFPSKREADYFLILKAREELGEISDLERQFELELRCPVGPDQSVVVARYVADFRYYEGTLQEGRWHYIDAKGVRTQMYALKKKWLELQDGIIIEEV